MNGLAPWLQAPLRRALDALAAGRLAHALLVCGPPGIGKRAFADALAKAMLCRARVEGAACGQCRDCTLQQAGTHPDWKRVTFEENDKTKAMRKEIVIEQIRDLGAWFALTPQRGGAQVALIDPAIGMNTNASNALLKTLEEPFHDRYLLLLSDAPMRLSATIRSRCQRIALQPGSVEESLEWLRSRGIEASAASAALEAARGNPGQAAQWIDEGLLAIRDAVGVDLVRLARGQAQPLDVAGAWLADERADQRLAFAADLAVDLQANAAGARDAVAVGSVRVVDAERLSAWFDAANRTRALLRTPIRADLALASLLHDWNQAVEAVGRTGR